MKIFVVSSMGRAGLNFLCASLDNHPEIIMMSCLSFFRTIESFKIDILKNSQNFPPKDEKKFFKSFLNFLYEKGKNNIETQTIRNLKERDKLYNLLLQEYKKQKKGYFYSKLFFALHFAFSKLHNKKLNKKKVIVVYEKNPMFLNNYNKYFKNPKIIILIKNPLMNYSGNKKNSANEGSYNPSKLNFLYGQIYSGIDFVNKNKSKVIKIENLNLNFKKEIKKITKFMGISMSQSLFRLTYLGRRWGSDSSYIISGKKKYTTKKVDVNYNLLSNQIKRALGIVDKKELIMIEAIFNKFYLKFNYNKIIKSNIYNNFLGYFYFLNTYKHDKVSTLYLKLKNALIRIIIIILPGNKKYKWLNLT